MNFDDIGMNDKSIAISFFFLDSDSKWYCWVNLLAQTFEHFVGGSGRWNCYQILKDLKCEMKII